MGGDSSGDDSASTTAVSPTTGDPATSGSTSSSPTSQSDPGAVTSTTAASTTTTPGSTPASGAQPIDPAWALYDDEFFVWGVADNDELNVRQGPGVGHPVIASFEPGERGIRRYDATRQANGGSWEPVAVPGGVGWVNLAYLRPEGSRPPRTEGTIEPSIETAADDVQALLGAGEYETLSGFIDLTRGVTISLHAFVRLGLGNSIDNIEERFPGSHVVEYHFEGTSIYGDFDWSSVRLVFDATRTAPTGRPALLAIVQDTWTI